LESVGPTGSLAQASDPAGHKKGRSPLNEQSKIHAKRPRYCSSELKFTWTVQTQSKKCMVREVKRTDLGTEVKKLQRRWKCDGWSVRFVCFKPFPPVLYLRLFSDFFLSSASSSLSLPGSCTFFFPVLQMLYAEKWKQRPKGSPCLFMVSLSFLVFPALSSPPSPLLLAFLISQQPKDEGKKLPLFSAFFFSPNCLPLSRFFLVFLYLFFFCSFFLFLLSPRH